MTEHATHIMRSNSLSAHATINISHRERMIVSALGILVTATERMILEWLINNEHLSIVAEMNAVRPRVTDLIKRGILVEVGSQADHRTGKSVRLVEIAL